MTSPGATSSGSAMGKNALRRPPLTVMPCMLGTGSAKFIRIWRTSAALVFGATARNSAAAPATCGVAIEVPLNRL